MWINREIYDALGAALKEETTRREQAEKELAIERNNIDWLRTQTNVAQARADALFTQMTSARVPTPYIDKADKSTRMDEEIEMTKGGALPSLEDPGDDIAAKLGIEHGSDGTLVYRT